MYVFCLLFYAIGGFICYDFYSAPLFPKKQQVVIVFLLFSFSEALTRFRIVTHFVFLTFYRWVQTLML